MKKFLLVTILFFLFVAQALAAPPDELIQCLVNKVIEDCAGYKIYGDCKKENGELKCGLSFDNDDNEAIKSYLYKWIVDWEKEGSLVQYSSSPFGCVNEEGSTHAFRVDMSYNPQWDGKNVSCPAKVTNLTIFGFSIYSLGGITIIGVSFFSFSIIGSLFTIIYLIRKKRISIVKYTIEVNKKVNRQG